MATFLLAFPHFLAISIQALTSTLLAALGFYVELQLRPATRASLNELPPPTTFIKPALSNTLASPIGYYALRFINFPMMLLAKSCKLVKLETQRA